MLYVIGSVKCDLCTRIWYSQPVGLHEAMLVTPRTVRLDAEGSGWRSTELDGLAKDFCPDCLAPPKEDTPR